MGQRIHGIVVMLVVFLLPNPTLAEKKNVLSTAELAEITARGRFLEHYDQASWHATDAVLAHKPKDGVVQRYIARQNDSAWTFAFGRFNEKNDAFLVAYEATQGVTPEQFTVKEYDPPKEDTGFYFQAAKSIRTALEEFQREKRPYNTVVLPMPSNQMYVYILPAQTDDNVYPLGGDARYLISADGNAIVEKRQLHKAILEIRNTSTQVAGVHRHVLTDTPEDTDVFHVLRQKNRCRNT